MYKNIHVARYSGKTPEEVVEASKQAIKDSPYKDLEDVDYGGIVDMFYYAEPVDKVLFIVVDNDEIVGILAAGTAPHVLVPHKRQAVEYLWWVREDKRKSRYGYELLKVYEDWAHWIGCDFIVTAHFTSNPEVSKILERRQYKSVEVAYIKEIE